MIRGLLVAALHCLLVLTLAGKYALDRERLPRQWVKCLPIDPSLPLRGRYLSLRLEMPGKTAPEVVPFFISDTAEDPTRHRQPGEEVWVEVTVPPEGLPRPIRLGIKKDGVISPLP